MDALSSATILKALDGLSLRSAATAQNIANAGTANYRPARVSFEAALASATSRGVASVQTLQPQIERDPLQVGTRLDLELATASTTAMRYAALIEVLGRQMQIESLVTGGGR